ncbi:class I SAM-dependent methyltransferase [Spirillospora sp. CA-294931]|uniref:class I SAM-dependent methyltransferase n=1 Tax=Spirillospora sp. CA-294931 TaxID=3240042 RepID=UPI003D8C5473
MTTPRDYDDDPGRFRLASEVTRAYLTGARTQHERVAEALSGAGLVLDIGCGEGALRVALPGTRVVGLDGSAAMLARHRAPAVRADAAALPFADGVFDGAAAVNVLDHLPDPVAAIAEARRVLVPGGLLVTASSGRSDSPELAAVWRPGPSSFDAEDAPALVGRVFGRVEVERWDAPLIVLPDHGAVRDYLIARHVAPAEAAALASRVEVPLTLTKRGAFVFARR